MEEDNYASKEHRIMHKRLKESEVKLEQLYEGSRDATYKFKSSFNDVQKAEKETELLRQQYYRMLEKSAYSEQEREEYFLSESKLADLKDMYICQSQKLAHENSAYVVYSNELIVQHESFVMDLLKDADEYYNTCQTIARDKENYKAQAADLQDKIQQYKRKIEQLSIERTELTSSKECLENECTNMKKLGEQFVIQRDELKRTNLSLQAEIERLSTASKQLMADVSELNTINISLTDKIEHYKKSEINLKDEISIHVQMQDNLENKLTDLRSKCFNLTEEKNDYVARNKMLSKEVTKSHLTLKKVEEQRDLFKEAFKQVKKEKEYFTQQCEKVKKEKDKFKVQYLELQNERELVGKEKDKIVACEHKTRRRNEDLYEAHKHLITELEDLRMVYRKAEDKVKRDCKLRQGLKETIKRLHREIEDERKKLLKCTKDVRVQTDPHLACENRDIAIQHAKLKMVQAIRERDRSLKETDSEQKKSSRLSDKLTYKEKLTSRQSKFLKQKCMELRIIQDHEKDVESSKLYLEKTLLRKQASSLIQRKLLKKTEKELGFYKGELSRSTENTKRETRVGITQTNNVIILNDVQGSRVFVQAKEMREKLEKANMQLNDFTKECTDLRKKEVDLQTEINRLNELVCKLNKKVASIEDSVSSQRTFFKTIKRAATPNSVAPSSIL